MSSTESSQESPEEALQEAMEANEGIRRLGRMAGVKSLNRNLRNEDAAVDRNIRWHEDALSDGDMSSTEEEPEAVDIMAARDVHVYQDPKQGGGGGQQGQPSPQAASAPGPKPSSGTAKNLAAAGLAAAGFGGAMAAPIAAWNLTKPAIEQPLEHEDATVRVGLGKIEDYLDETERSN